MKFKNPNSVPCTPKSWRGTLPNGEPFKLAWDCREPYGVFFSRVTRFHSDNGMEPPTSEAVVDAICRQLPRHWCVDDSYYVAPAPVVRGCKGCGRF